MSVAPASAGGFSPESVGHPHEQTGRHCLYEKRRCNFAHLAVDADAKFRPGRIDPHACRPDLPESLHLFDAAAEELCGRANELETAHELKRVDGEAAIVERRLRRRDPGLRQI